MDLLARELPTGRWGQNFEPGIVDGLLEAATTANDCVQAYASAYLAESVANQQIRDADLVGERGVSVGLRRACADQRFGVAVDHSDALLREWARMALHYATVTATALRLTAGDPTAPVDDIQFWLGDVKPVSALYATPAVLVTSLAPAPLQQTNDDPYEVQELAAAYQRILAALRIGHAHHTPPELFDDDLPGDHDSIAGLGLLDLAGALHDYGTHALWLLAGQTPPADS